MNFVSVSFILSILEASSGKFGYATAPNVSYIVIIVSLRLRVSVTRRYPKIDESSLALFLTGIFDLYFLSGPTSDGNVYGTSNHVFNILRKGSVRSKLAVYKNIKIKRLR